MAECTGEASREAALGGGKEAQGCLTRVTRGNKQTAHARVIHPEVKDLSG